MRKGRDGEQKQKTKENNDGNSGPLTSLPVDRLNGDRLQRRRSCQLLKFARIMIFGTCTCIAANKQQQHMWNAMLARA